MKAAGKRQKGGRLERVISKMIRESGLDPQAKRSFQSGAHWSWKSDIYTSLPFSIESKNQERISKFWEWWEQAESQASAMKPPVLVHSANFRPVMVSMKFETFLDVLVELNDWKTKAHELEGK